MAGNGPSRQLEFAPRVTEELKHLGITARRFGRWDRLRASVREIEDRLVLTPLEWGDPNFRLRQLGLTMFNGVAGMLHGYYAVDEARRTVYIKRVKFMPGALPE
jgi:hypothetical protein